MKLHMGQLVKMQCGSSKPKTDDVMRIPKRDIGVPFSEEIIGIIRRREERRDERPQPVIDIPILPPRPSPPTRDPDAERGVVIIDLM